MLDDVPLRIFWNGEPHEVTQGWYRCDKPRGAAARAVYAVTNVNGLAQACPSLPTAKAAFFFGQTKPDDRYWSTTREEGQEFSDVDLFARGRVVYYGADLPALGDQVVVPAVGTLPGVWAHAMAHDNLLRFAENYKRGVTTVFDITIDPGSIESGIAVLFILFAIAYFEAWRFGSPSSGPHSGQSPPMCSPRNSQEAIADNYVLLQFALFLVISSFLLFVTTWVVFHYLNLYPINWLQLMGLQSLIGALVWQRPVERVMHNSVLIMNDRAQQPVDDRGGPTNDGGATATKQGE